MAEAWISAVKRPPTWDDYNSKHKYTEAIETYYSSKLLGGGSMFESKTFDNGNYTYEFYQW